MLIKVICLFLSLFFGVLISVKGVRGEAIPAWMFVGLATGVTGFITLQWLI